MKLAASLLILATLLSAAPRNQTTTLVVPSETAHHSHKRLWVTLGILVGSGIATGAVLASDQRHGQTIHSSCYKLTIGPNYCTVTGAR